MSWRVAAALSTCAAIIVVAAIVLVSPPSRPPLPEGTRADRIVVEKSLRMMILLNAGAPVQTYSIAIGRGGIEPKQREGDNKTPEGVYTIDGRNTQSAFHRSLHISYPDAKDRQAARVRGEPPGGDIMIHGIRNGLGWLGSWHRTLDWTAGCIAVTDVEMDEIWRIVADGTPIEIRR